MILRRVFVFYIWGGYVENKEPGQIFGDLVVSYTSKVKIPVFSYLYCDFERGLHSWVLGLRFLPTAV